MSDLHPGRILVVEDDRFNRINLTRQLKQQGHEVTTAENGKEALDLLRSQSFDVMLLDIVMPVMDGFELLSILRDKKKLGSFPVIVISAAEEIDSAVRCIEAGAEDYLTKPFDPVLLKARIDGSLEKKRLRDQEKAYLRQIKKERDRSEQLLRNMLPTPVAQSLKEGQQTIAEFFQDVSVLFADIANFHEILSLMSPAELVVLLNVVFSTFDRLAQQYGLEKIRTMGDAYMAAGGVPLPSEGHLEAIAQMALEMKRESVQFRVVKGEPVLIRISIDVGPVVAGVIGTARYSYDLWGRMVSRAREIHSLGPAGQILVSYPVYQRLQHLYLFQRWESPPQLSRELQEEQASEESTQLYLLLKQRP
jgi:adenylate cyclase